MSGTSHPCQQLADNSEFLAACLLYLADYCSCRLWEALLQQTIRPKGVFIFLGSKGGAGRTASSVVLATGLARIGLRPIHLQLTASTLPPVLVGAEGVPFATASVPEHLATKERIADILEVHSDCATIVIDTPKRTSSQFLFKRVSVALFPMRPARYEIEVAIRDYRAFRLCSYETEAKLNNSASTSQGSSSAWLVPICWPLGIDQRHVAFQIAQLNARAKENSAAPSILTTGIPTLPRDDLDDLINGTHFHCSAIINTAAVNFAQQAFKALRK